MAFLIVISYLKSNPLYNQWLVNTGASRFLTSTQTPLSRVTYFTGRYHPNNFTVY
jgi:hypothetical protein